MVFIGRKRKKRYELQVAPSCNSSIDSPLKSKLFPTKRCSDRFCWGKGGGLCAGEAAYTILTHLFGRKIAEVYHTQFKWDIVATLPQNFTLSDKEIEKWYIKAQRKHNKKWRLYNLKDIQDSVRELSV